MKVTEVSTEYLVKWLQEHIDDSNRMLSAGVEDEAHELAFQQALRFVQRSVEAWEKIG